MTAPIIYRTGIDPAWIDYNDHLRDAYYGLIVSLAVDGLMHRLGLDDAYREQTRNTLFTLELHMHFLREVKGSETLEVSVRILGLDRKRLHAAFDLRCAGRPEIVATAETMLLHVHQGATPGATPFPPEIFTQLSAFAESSRAQSMQAAGDVPPGSRRIELRSPSA
ncbi:MAG: thioesterase family protein [Sinobacteraceae bacterium]|nr:thioesterase family protein [Nevskiaceae bacterium]